MEEDIKNLVEAGIEALVQTHHVHNDLDAAGLKKRRKNRFGDVTLKADYDCESAIILWLKEACIPARIISEEHGAKNLFRGPAEYTVIIDGIDGSGNYEKGRGRLRYASMLGIFKGTNPKYEDYLFSGIMEHSAQKLFYAAKGKGSFLKPIERSNAVTIPIHSSSTKTLDANTLIYIDEGIPFNKAVFSEKLNRKIPYQYLGCSAAYYADVASGKADVALECTRKNNLEIAAAFGLVAEAGGVMIDRTGESISKKEYASFGQQGNIPIITAATPELGRSVIAFLNK